MVILVIIEWFKWARLDRSRTRFVVNSHAIGVIDYDDYWCGEGNCVLFLAFSLTFFCRLVSLFPFFSGCRNLPFAIRPSDGSLRLIEAVYPTALPTETSALPAHSPASGPASSLPAGPIGAFPISLSPPYSSAHSLLCHTLISFSLSFNIRNISHCTVHPV